MGILLSTNHRGPQPSASHYAALGVLRRETMLPGLGGLGGLAGILPIYGILFIINLIIQLLTGGLNELFATPAAM